MTIKRKHRTREERLRDLDEKLELLAKKALESAQQFEAQKEAARKERVREEQKTISTAIAVRKQGIGWQDRADQLQEKAGGAFERASDLIRSLGHDPVTFWLEYDKEQADALR